VIKYSLLLLFVFTFNISDSLALSGSENRSGSVPGGSSRPSNITGASGGPCTIRNQECVRSGSQVQIDLAGQCMCVGSTCFEVAIGKYGPNQTRNGTGRIGRASGSAYSTTRATTTTWSTDAVSMGIPQNDSGTSASGANLPVTTGGKWIHKVGVDSNGRCIDPPTRYRTQGCIGVPCQSWPLVKNAMGQSLTVCGGASTDDEIASVIGCNRTRYCPRSQRQPEHRGCDRVYTMAQARGRDVSRISCTEPNGVVASPPFPVPLNTIGDEYRPENRSVF